MAVTSQQRIVARVGRSLCLGLGMATLFAGAMGGAGCGGCRPARSVAATSDGADNNDGGDGDDGGMAQHVRLTGRVYTVDGPLAGAQLAASSGGITLGETRSDDDGQFLIEVRATGAVRLEARRAGYAVEAIDGIGPLSGPIELFLKRRVVLHGVTRVEGKARNDVELAFACGDSVAHARSGPDGQFTSPPILVAAGAAPVRCAVRAMAPGLVALLPSVLVTPAEALVLALRPSLSQSGRVVDDRGQAVSGASVLAEVGRLPPLVAHSGLDGTFRVEGLVEGPVTLTAHAEEMLSTAGSTATVTVGKARTVVVLNLARGATVTGLVLDERGPPVAHVSLQISGLASDGSPLAVSASQRQSTPAAGNRLEAAGELGVLRGPIPYPPLVPLAVLAATAASTANGFLSDARGAFKITGLPGGKVLVTATHPDFAIGRSAEVTLTPGAVVDTRVILRRGVSVYGVVVDERGRGLGGAELTLDGAERGKTDKRGGFVLERLAEPGTLTARLSGYRSASLAVSPTELGPKPIELVLTSARGNILGQVLDERSMPLQGAIVRLRESGKGAVASASTDRSGRFSLEGLAPDETAHLVVEHPDFAPLETETQASDRASELRLTMQPGAGLDGTVRDERTGVVPPGLRLEVQSAGGTSQVTVERDGHFRSWGLRPGVATLRARAAGWVPVDLPLELVAGTRPRDITLRDLRVRLERGGRIQGRVVDDRGDPLSAEVRVVGLPATGAATRSDGHGVFLLEGLKPGRVRLRATVGERAVEMDLDVVSQIDTQTTLVVP